MSETAFERDSKKAVRQLEWWEVIGCSYKGNTTKRDGKVVSCGHRHQSEAACAECVLDMRKSRPGKCQNYRAAHMLVLVMKKEKP